VKLSAWLKVLARNRWAVGPRRVPMVTFIAGLGAFNSSMGLLQQLLCSRRIRNTELADDPIFVLGHWRSGTTLLHELLVCDPRHTFPNTYSCFAPNHFLLTEKLLKKRLNWLLPPQRPMDNMAIRWEYPQEDEWALCNMGLRSPYWTMLFPNRPPQDPEYLTLRDVPLAEREQWKSTLLRFLKCLTVREPKRIVLKTPLHTGRIRTLLEVFPKARFVHIVRDPFVIFPSTVYTWKQLYRYQGAQIPRYEGLNEYVLATFCKMYEAFEEDVKRIEPGRLDEVRYEDLTNDPVGQMRGIYERLQLGEFDLARPGIQRYAAKTAGYQTNRFEISPAERQQIASRWGAYVEKYGYRALGTDGV
jgi:hypothetical protein